MDPVVYERLNMSFTAEFFEALQSELEWSSYDAWKNEFDPIGLVARPSVGSETELALSRMRRNRRMLGCEALKRTASLLGIPCHVRRPGGHNVVIAELGEVLVVLEPADYIGQRPDRSNYKLEMALHGLGESRQPFLPFVPPLCEIVMPGGMLVVIQHVVSLASDELLDHRLTDIRMIVPDKSLETALVDLSMLDGGFDKHFGAGVDEAATIVDAQPRLRSVARRRDHRSRDRKKNGGESA
ncbi:hypothetical protein [Tranquillimonas rosea]|uniref:hypothetical protein n=1 Tax=Tranquillimonas rosea TaxID=641238 RepID=UPI003BA9AE40